MFKRETKLFTVMQIFVQICLDCNVDCFIYSRSQKKKIKNIENRFFLMISILNYFYNFIKILNSET